MEDYILAPEAATDIVKIRYYLRTKASARVAEKMTHALYKKMKFLSDWPNSGHLREDLTDKPVKFFSVHSYLIVYQPQTMPLRIVSVLHGRQDIQNILGERL